MPIVDVLVILLIFGVALWMINVYIPPPARIILSVVVGLILVIWLVSIFGLLTYTIPVRR